MKTIFKQVALATALLPFAINAYGIGFTTLYTFYAPRGAGPHSPLAQPLLLGGLLYDVCQVGDVFVVGTNGTGFNYTDIYGFAAGNSGLISSGGTLYGTSYHGGANSLGSVYALANDLSQATILHSFNGSDGYNPSADLVLSGNTLYGTTSGSVFRINTDGSDFTNLFDVYHAPGGGIPEAGLAVSGNTLYGSTVNGGVGYGALFSINTDGTGFTHIYEFGGSDGRAPSADLVLSGNTLYGTTYEDGAHANGGFSPGTVFRINTDGTDFTNLYNFAGNDGYSPNSALVLSGNTLYGTTSGGGPNFGSGTVFAINTDGTGFTNLYTFSGADGALPEGVILLNNTLYGTTDVGGVWGDGIVFALTLSPGSIPLNFQSIGSAVVLSWGNAAFSLQAAPAATGTYTNIPGATTPYTNAISGSQEFFRLRSN